jgi:hypothetical protein
MSEWDWPAGIQRAKELSAEVDQMTERLLAGSVSVAEYHRWFVADVRPAAELLREHFAAQGELSPAQREQVADFQCDLRKTVTVIRDHADADDARTVWEGQQAGARRFVLKRMELALMKESGDE